MNGQFGTLPPQMNPFQDEEETRRRIAHAKKMQFQAQAKPVVPTVPAPVNLAVSTTDPWGEGGTGIGLKILCGVLGLIVVVLVVVLIVKLVHHKGQTSQVSPGDSQLPMSLQGGGFDFGNASLMSTS